VQRVVTIELQSHFHKDMEEPFRNFLDEGWKIVSLDCTSASMNESKASCWIVACMEKDRA
jgi:hypothetical protein